MFNVLDLDNKCPFAQRPFSVKKWLLWFGLWLIISLWVMSPRWGQRPLLAQSSTNGITEPTNGDTISGVVMVQGTAADANYLRYELAFWPESNPDAGWIVFAEGDHQVLNDTLAVWDTTIGHDIGAPVFTDGRYRLRLRVVRTDYNYDEYYVTNLMIANDDLTATPTITATLASAAAATAVSLPPPTSSDLFQQPTLLPSLTPFPTPSPPATPVNAPTASSNTTETAAGDGGNTDGGLLGQIRSIEGHRFIDAFWQGARWVVYLFATFAGYLLLRSIGRWLWRRFWTQRI